MTPPAPSPLPFPVARLKRRAFNAKSAKDRHDNAYHAFEVSVHLGVAIEPPASPAALAHATIGSWVAALRVPDKRLDDPRLLALFRLFTEVGSGRASESQSVTARQLLDALPAYRNKAIGHGAVRTQEYYEASGKTLIAGIEAAWEAGIFLPPDCDLVYVGTVERASGGHHLARVLSLGGESPVVIDPAGTPVPDDVLPNRMYVRSDDRWRTLHPWFLFSDDTERVLSFNGLSRKVEYLDYSSGDSLDGPKLEAEFPGIEADVRALFSKEGVAIEAPARKAGENWIGDYRILGKLGEGGMGTVFLAIQASLDRYVALKVLRQPASADQVAAARFEREIRALSLCEHPNVVKILGSGSDKGGRFFAMEYVEGADLSRIGKALSSSNDVDAAVTTAVEEVHREQAESVGAIPDIPRGALPPATGSGRYRQMARIFRDAARGVQHIHEHGMIHRDIKPSNIMVTAQDQRVVVMDLGLALIDAAPVSLTKDKSQVLGTLRYMAPEQLVRDKLGLDRRADVYSLGASFYELLTDRPFFDGDSEVRMMEQVLREEPAPIEAVAPKVPKDLAVIVRKAIAKDPKVRYETASQFASDLDAFLEGRPISARPPSLAYVLSLAIRRNTQVAVAVLGALLLIVGLTVGFMLLLATQRDRAREAERKEVDQAVIAREAAGRERATASRADAQARQARVSAMVIQAREAMARDARTAGLILREIPDAFATRAVIQTGLDLAALPIPRLHLRGTNADFSPDGSRIVTASDDGTARVWDSGSGAKIATLEGHGDRVVSARFSPDGTKVLTTSWDSTIRVWDLSGRDPAVVLRPPEHMVYAARWSPDGRRVLAWAIGSRMYSAAFLFQASGAGAPTALGGGIVSNASFSPDGARVVTASYDGHARVWQVDGGDALVLRGPEETVEVYSNGSRAVELRAPALLHAGFSREGTDVATVSEDGVIRVWTAGAGAARPALILERRFTSVYPVPGPGSNIIVTGPDGVVGIWDPFDPNEPSALWLPPGVEPPPAPQDPAAEPPTTASRFFEQLLLSPDGRRAAMSFESHRAQVWDIDGVRGSIDVGDEKGERLLAFSPDGTQLATLNVFDNVFIWDAGRAPDTIIESSRIQETGLRLSPTGRIVACGCGTNLIRIREAGSGRPLSVLDGHEKTIIDLAFSSDERMIATASEDGTARLWDVASGREIRVFSIQGHSLTGIAFSPDGEHLVTGSCDGTPRVWSVDGGQPIVLSGHPPTIDQKVIVKQGLYELQQMNDCVSVAFSHDGKWVVTAANDRTARVWDARSGREIAMFDHPSSVESAALSPDGTLLATTSFPGLRLWDISTGRMVAEVPDSPTGRAEFAPHRNALLVVFDSPYVWEPDWNDHPIKLPGPMMVDWAAFSADGKQVVSSDWASVRVTNIDWPTMRRGLWERIPVRLSIDQRRDLLGFEPIETEPVLTAPAVHASRK